MQGCSHFWWVSKRAALCINLDLHAIKSGTEIFFLDSFTVNLIWNLILDGLSGNMWQAGKKSTETDKWTSGLTMMFK